MPLSPDDPRVHISRTAFVVYEHNDLAKAREFYLDFGMSIAEERPGEQIFFRGYGTEPFVYVARQAAGESRFVGAAYEVDSRGELEKAAGFPGAGCIAKLDAPGGGEAVTLTDPIGNQVFLVYGQTRRTPEPHSLERLTVNYEDDKPRKGTFHRFKTGPARVYRWGHYGVTYSAGKYQEMYDWYTTTLSLAPSDIVYKDGKPITCFFHIDRGLEFTDHHSFFFKPCKNGRPAVAHSAFEVHDFDVQQLGHQYLKSRGYELCWGVGRVGPTSLLEFASPGLY